MKRTALALALILALLFSAMTIIKLVNWAHANPYPYTDCDASFVTVSLLSPENKTYNTNRILVTIFAGAYPGVTGVGYCVDGGPYTELAPELWNGHTFNLSVWLNELSKGSHVILARATTLEAPNNVLSAEFQVNFTITRTLEPPSPFPSPTSTPGSFPPTLVITVFAAFIAITTIALLVYSKKRKH